MDIDDEIKRLDKILGENCLIGEDENPLAREIMRQIDDLKWEKILIECE